MLLTLCTVKQFNTATSMLVPSQKDNSLAKSTSPATVGAFSFSLCPKLQICIGTREMKFTLEYPQLLHWSKLREGFWVNCARARVLPSQQPDCCAYVLPPPPANIQF